MPYTNEHACRIRNPAEFTRFRRDNDKDPNVIIGFRSDDSSDIQAYRYPKDKWSVETARSHCDKHDGLFEPAMEEESVTSKASSGRAVRTQDSETDAESKPETRYCAPCKLTVEQETRAEGSEAPKLVGYAAIFDVETEMFPGYRETIAKGAFKRTLAEKADVRALVDHNPSKILGRSKAGTLDVREDAMGLKVAITPPDTQAGRDIITSVERGDVDQMSFAFPWSNLETQKITENEDGTFIRILDDLDLLDVSIVTYAQYPETSVTLRSLQEAQKGGNEKPKLDETTPTESQEDDTTAAVPQEPDSLRRKADLQDLDSKFGHLADKLEE